MKLRDIKNLLDCEVLNGEDQLEIEVSYACACDLMSDVLAFAKEGSLLLTGLINPQVIRTAEMIDIVAVLFVRGKVPLKETSELAKEKGIPLLTTKYILFETCGRLFQAGIHGSVKKIN